MPSLQKNLHVQIQTVKHKLNEVERNIIMCYPAKQYTSNILLESCLIKTQMAKKVCEKILTNPKGDCVIELSQLKTLLKVIHKNTHEMTASLLYHDAKE